MIPFLHGVHRATIAHRTCGGPTSEARVMWPFLGWLAVAAALREEGKGPP